MYIYRGTVQFNQLVSPAAIMAIEVALSLVDNPLDNLVAAEEERAQRLEAEPPIQSVKIRNEPQAQNWDRFRFQQFGTRPTRVPFAPTSGNHRPGHNNRPRRIGYQRRAA